MSYEYKLRRITDFFGQSGTPTMKFQLHIQPEGADSYNGPFTLKGVQFEPAFNIFFESSFAEYPHVAGLSESIDSFIDMLNISLNQLKIRMDKATGHVHACQPKTA